MHVAVTGAKRSGLGNKSRSDVVAVAQKSEKRSDTVAVVQKSEERSAVAVLQR